MDIIEKSGPAAWASYLINGDASGISEEDKRNADRWLALLMDPTREPGEPGPLRGPVDAVEDGFAWTSDAHRAVGIRYGCDRAIYTFLRG